MQQRTLAGQPQIDETLRRRRRCVRRICCCRSGAAAAVLQLVQLGTDSGQVAAHDGVLQLIEPVAVGQLLCICCGSCTSSKAVTNTIAHTYKTFVCIVYTCSRMSHARNLIETLHKFVVALAELDLRHAPDVSPSFTHPASVWSPRPESSRTRPEPSPCPAAGQCESSTPYSPMRGTD